MLDWQASTPAVVRSQIFYRMDLFTGVASLVSNTGSTRLTGLALDTNGVIYMARRRTKPQALAQNIQKQKILSDNKKILHRKYR